jgi:hypothetical protein
MRVRSNLPQGRVALWERDPAHPGGEVFIAGPGEFEVGQTERVRAYLKQGRLARVEDPGEAEPKPEPEPRPGPEPERKPGKRGSTLPSGSSPHRGKR